MIITIFHHSTDRATDDSDNETLAQHQLRLKNLKNFSKDEKTKKTSSSKTTTSGVKRKRQEKEIKQKAKKKTAKSMSTLTPFKGFRTSDIARKIRSSSGKRVKMMAHTKNSTKRTKRKDGTPTNVKRKQSKRDDTNNNDSASTSPQPKEKKRLRYEQEKPKEQLKVKKSEAQQVPNNQINEPFGLRIKSSPSSLIDAVKVMSEEQREAVIDMGFESLLNMKMHQCPARLGHYLLEMFDDTNLIMRTGKGEISLTPQIVHEVLGIPIGSKSLEEVKRVKRKNPLLKLWEEQFGTDIAKGVVVKKIEETDDDGILFKLNFMTLFSNCFHECYTSGNCKKDIVYKVACY